MKPKINISAPALEALYTGRPMRQDVVSEREPSAREVLAEKMQKSLERIMPANSARKAARKLTGHTYDMGVVDVTPAGLPLWAYEGGQQLAKAYQAAGEGEYGTAALEGLMGALNVAPGAHAAGKIVPEALNVGAAALHKRLEPYAEKPWRKGEWGGKPQYPQEEALETARKNAVTMLGLPEENTAMDRARALAGLTEENAVQRAHEIGQLNFRNIPLNEFKGKLIHKSPVYNKQQSSEYRLGEINGEPVYMRKANHWGSFGTNIKEGSGLAELFPDIAQETEDVYGRLGKQSNDWQISGPVSEQLEVLQNKWQQAEPFSEERDLLWNKMYPLMKKSQAGYIPVKELIGRLPEKIAHFENFSAPIVNLPTGKIRSRFAAFDPARINENDLLGYADLGILPYLAGAGALGGLGLSQIKEPEKKKGAKNGK